MLKLQIEVVQLPGQAELGSSNTIKFSYKAKTGLDPQLNGKGTELGRIEDQWGVYTFGD